MSTETTVRDPEVIEVIWIKSAGPKGGRPIERSMFVDSAGLKTLIETLPPSDRVRVSGPDGAQEYAGQGGRDGGGVTALVPSMTEEQLQVEFMRRANYAVMEDMAKIRRSFTEGTLETMKIMRGQLDMVQALHEKLADVCEKQAEKADGDLVDQIVSGLATQIPALGAMLRSRAV